MRFVLLCFIVAIAFASCNNNEDCSYAGRCVNNTCICGKMFKGDDCSMINFLPQDPNRYAAFRSADNSSWCGSAIKGEDGLYHLFTSVMENHLDLDAWENHSTVVHAISTDPQGPYTYKTMLRDVESHNPSIYRAPDGTYVLFYIRWKKPFNRREISIAYTKDLNGEWTFIEPFVGEEKMKEFDPDWRPVGNPSAIFFPNGSFYLYFTNCYNHGHSQCDIRAQGVAFAQNYTSEIQYLHNKTVLYHPWDEGYCVNEDAHAFYYETGYHFITHSEDGVWSGGHFYSPDGVNNWKYKRGYTKTMEFTDGTNITFNNRERANILWENGVPRYLFNGVKPKQGRTFTTVQELAH
ncbi:hypothetical protein WA158_005105 [Blastocystis sp. Blastoise]